MAERDRSAEPVRAGVVGVGSMGRNHARVYSELPGVDLVGVCDRDRQRATTVAGQYGTGALAFEELLATADVVSVAVPTPAHYPVATDCVAAGVHALIEKPFVADPGQGRELIRRAGEAGVTLQVGHVERFNPAVVALQDVVSDLDVIAVSARRLGPPRERAIGDSAVLDLMTHDLDVVLSLLDAEVEAVEAVGVRDNAHAAAHLTFDDGTVAEFTASRVTQQKIRRLAVTARNCRVNVDYANQSVDIHRHSMPEYIEADGDLRYRHESIVERPTVQNGEPLKKELASFVECATTGEEPVVTAEDGLRVLEVAREIDDLAAAGRMETREVEAT